jgi:hypothetical protein
LDARPSASYTKATMAKRAIKTVGFVLILAAGFLAVSAQTNTVKTSSACGGHGSGSTSKPSLPR